jgi:tripartite-type tricarboxylate transporter receptor subunit TctC
MHHIGLSTTPALYKKKLPFDPMKDLAPVGLVAEAPMSIVARKDFPPNGLKELIAYLRERKDKTAYASAGIGGASFLCGLLLEQKLGVKFTQVPYTGVAPAYTDMLSGRTDVICDLTTGTAGYIQTDKLKPYALTADKRISTLPDLPTTKEAGLPDFEVSVWYGLYAPAKTPPEVVQRLSKALQVVMQDPKVAERLAATGTTLVTPAQATPEALTKRLKDQIELWTPIIESSGVSTN